MQILIHETDTPPAVVYQALFTAIEAGKGTVHVKLTDGPCVKLRNVTASAGYDANGRPRFFLRDDVGTLVYVDDTDWIEGYEGR